MNEKLIIGILLFTAFFSIFSCYQVILYQQKLIEERNNILSELYNVRSDILVSIISKEKLSQYMFDYVDEYCKNKGYQFGIWNPINLTFICCDYNKTIDQLICEHFKQENLCGE